MYACLTERHSWVSEVLEKFLMRKHLKNSVKKTQDQLLKQVTDMDRRILQPLVRRNLKEIKIWSGSIRGSVQVTADHDLAWVGPRWFSWSLSTQDVLRFHGKTTCSSSSCLAVRGDASVHSCQTSGSLMLCQSHCGQGGPSRIRKGKKTKLWSSVLYLPCWGWWSKVTYFLWNDHRAKGFFFKFCFVCLKHLPALLLLVGKHFGWTAAGTDEMLKHIHKCLLSWVNISFGHCDAAIGWVPICDTILACTWASMSLIQVIQAFDRDSVFSNPHNAWKQGNLRDRPTNSVFWKSPGSSPEKLISSCSLSVSSMLQHDLHAYSLCFSLLFLCSFAMYLRYSPVYYQETNRCLTDGNLPGINCWETAHSRDLIPSYSTPYTNWHSW